MMNVNFQRFKVTGSWRNARKVVYALICSKRICACCNPNMELWHCRFGHLGKDNFSKLVNNDMVTGMVSSKDENI